MRAEFPKMNMTGVMKNVHVRQVCMCLVWDKYVCVFVAFTTSIPVQMSLLKRPNTLIQTIGLDYYEFNELFIMSSWSDAQAQAKKHNENKNIYIAIYRPTLYVHDGL